MDAVYLERFLDVLRREHILAEEHVLIETGAGEQLSLGAAALHRGDENFRYMCASA